MSGFDDWRDCDKPFSREEMFQTITDVVRELDSQAEEAGDAPWSEYIIKLYTAYVFLTLAFVPVNDRSLGLAIHTIHTTVSRRTKGRTVTKSGPTLLFSELRVEPNKSK